MMETQERKLILTGTCNINKHEINTCNHTKHVRNCHSFRKKNNSTCSK